MKQRIVLKIFNMVTGIIAEILLTCALMVFAFLIGFIMLRLF